MAQPYYNTHPDQQYGHQQEQQQHYQQNQQYYPQDEFMDAYQPNYHHPQPNEYSHQYPPPADIYHHAQGQPYPDQHQHQQQHQHPSTTYPPDHHYHSEETYHPDYDPAHGLDEKYPPAELYPPNSAHPVINLNQPPSMDRLNTASTFANPTRGSVAAQMAAEGAIPEKAGLRMWRSDEHSGAFTRGGKSQSCRRCCCCTSIVIVLVVVGFIAGFLLWVRPPNATFNGIAPPTAGNQVDLQPNGFLLNFDLNIGVTNPNFFGASFSKISAKAYYPLNKTTALGGGELENVDIKPHSNTTINFPFQINYTTSLDPNRAILADIASRCGFLGNPKSPIKIAFDITLKLKVLAITISPTFSSSNTFTCPLKQSDFTSVLGGAQSLDALSNLLTGSSGEPKRRLVRRGGVSGASPQEEEQEHRPSPISPQEEDQLLEALVQKALATPPAHSSEQLVLSRIQFSPPNIHDGPFSRLRSLLLDRLVRFPPLNNLLSLVRTTRNL